MALLLGGAIVPWALGACVAGESDAGRAAYAPLGTPLTMLSEADRGRFLLGKALFERLATPEEGLGPLFNASRCSDCHSEPAVGGTSLQLVTKASRFQGGVCSELPEQGGGNIQQRTTPALRALGVLAEALPRDATERAVFLAPPLFGLGLLEAVPAATIVAGEDPDDRDGDGVSGRAHRTPDGQLGRFGWKADSPSIAHFVDTAIRFEIGLTTPKFPVEEGVNGQPLPPGVDPVPEPEIDSNGVALLVDFVRYLGAPAPSADSVRTGAGSGSGEVEHGRRLFSETGCAICHAPELRTAEAAGVPGGIAIHPYTDLLLHDMGPDLGSTCAGAASPTEYRTAPLWGLRHRDLFLHDGRATSVAQAIELHGGEGAGARALFEALVPADQSALLAFLGTL